MGLKPYWRAQSEKDLPEMKIPKSNPFSNKLAPVCTSLTLRLSGGDGSETMTLYGREAWALGCLIGAGEGGCSPIDQPGPRWSSYVHRLRDKGILIETCREGHRGPFAGWHGRYVLRSRVDITGKTTPADAPGGAP